MATFIQELIENFGKVDLNFVEDPNTEIGENDHVVGTCHKDAIKIYAMREQASVAFKELKRRILHLIADSDCESSSPPPQFEELQQQLIIVNEKKDILDSIFWAILRHQFSELANKHHIGIRKEWQVVWTGTTSQIPDFLRKLFESFGETPPDMK